jgi:1,4-alpha-glucan branching enzyme
LREFKIKNELAITVHIAGEFNAWKPDDIELQMDKTDGLWKGSKMLKIDTSKDHYQYKFIIDGVDWVVNDQEPICTDSAGNENNKVDIPLGVKKFDRDEVKTIPLGDDHWYDIRYARHVLNQIHDQCNEYNAEIAIERPTLDLMVTTRQFKTGQLEGFDSYVSI